MLFAPQRQNYSRPTWACKVRTVLYRLRYSMEMQSGGNTKAFLSEFKQRLIDCFSQDWNVSLDTHHFYCVYSSFKREVKTCDCLCLLRNIYMLERFLVGLQLACMYPLGSHYLKYKLINQHGTSCPFCR